MDNITTVDVSNSRLSRSLDLSFLQLVTYKAQLGEGLGMCVCIVRATFAPNCAGIDYHCIPSELSAANLSRGGTTALT